MLFVLPIRDDNMIAYMTIRWFDTIHMSIYQSDKLFETYLTGLCIQYLKFILPKNIQQLNCVYLPQYATLSENLN